MYGSMITIFIAVATVGAGLMAGVYFAFSAFIIRALDQLGGERAADAMNAINDVILRSWFLPLFFGSTLLYISLAAVALFNTEMDGRWILFAAGLIYFTGMFLCTALLNVPLNHRLAKASGSANAIADAWKHYYKHWMAWNHLRVVSSLAALVLGICHLVGYA